MCGPTSSEKLLEGQSQSFSSMLQGNYSTLFGNQLDVLGAINKSLSPILAAGPNQQGFSAQELAALNTQAINSAGAAARNASQAVGNFGAGQGAGGSTGIVSGVQKQLQSSVASSSANQLATTQDQITQANYNQGSANYWRAQGGMEQLAQGYSPNAAASAGIESNKNAFGEASTIQQQQQQEDQMIAGGITSLATGAIGAANGSDLLSSLGGGKIFGSGGFFG